MRRGKSALPKPSSLSSLKGELENMDRLEFPKRCCIYRVPPQLRKMNAAAYTPIMVSIGPYHRGNKRFKAMEEVKMWFLHKFLKRITGEKSFDDLVNVLRDQEDEIRQCYSETIAMESDEFVRMILTDACFIIEYFLVWVDNDNWHTKLWSWETTRDLILLENQLPFFVLKTIFDLAFPNGYCNPLPFEFVTFLGLYGAFSCSGNKKLLDESTFPLFVERHLPRLIDGTRQMHHLCDMLRIIHVPLDGQVPREHSGRIMKPVYNASKLYDAGIKFEVNEDDAEILKLQFSKGVLRIPRIVVCDSTETLLRNMVAFEQCHSLPSRNMTDYIILLEYLIRTGKDAEILVEKGIICNYLGESDAVASITKRLGRHTTYTEFNDDYISLFKELNDFCDSLYHRYKAIFKQQYWSTPWRIASFSGAILLLLLTLIQTISSVVALFQK